MCTEANVDEVQDDECMAWIRTEKENLRGDKTHQFIRSRTSSSSSASSSHSPTLTLIGCRRVAHARSPLTSRLHATVPWSKEIVPSRPACGVHLSIPHPASHPRGPHTASHLSIYERLSCPLPRECSFCINRFDRTRTERQRMKQRDNTTRAVFYRLHTVGDGTELFRLPHRRCVRASPAGLAEILMLHSGPSLPPAATTRVVYRSSSTEITIQTSVSTCECFDSR